MASSPPFKAQMKRKLYVCAVALLCAVAGGILGLSSNVATPPSRVASPASRKTKREIGNSAARPKSAVASRADGIPAARARLVEHYGKLPFRFEANSGQTDSQVKFVSRGRGFTLFLTGDEAVLCLRGASQKANGKRQMAKVEGYTRSHLPSLFPSLDSLASGARHNQQPTTPAISFGKVRSSIDNPRNPNPEFPTPTVLRMKLAGANVKAKVVGLDELPGKSNYFIGNDPKKWRTNVSNYAQVKYERVYPGIDLIYYGSEGGQLEYDFVVAPGADPKSIAFDIDGAVAAASDRRTAMRTSPLQIDANGDLIISTGTGYVRFHKPVVYQPVAPPSGRHAGGTPALQPNPKSKIANPKSVDGRFVLLASNQIGFEVANYDKTKPLVIDPVLEYSTYLGGSGDDGGLGIAVDSFGNAYVTGSTYSTDFPGMNPLPTPNDALQGFSDVFVSKLSADGSAILYSTYLGGSASENGRGIAVDSSGNAYITGATSSTDFPTLNAFQSVNQLGGGTPTDAFVTQLNADGSALLYSTFLGGFARDSGNAIAVDSGGFAYVTGAADSGDFPTASPFQAVCGGCQAQGPDAFVAKIDPTKSGSDSLVYSSFIGGTTRDEAFGIAVDAASNAYVTGSTNGAFPITPGAFDTVSSGADAFVVKVNAAGSAVLYSTYLGGSGNEYGNGIAVDSNGNAYITGPTSSTDFPTLNAFQSVNHLGGGNPTDAFVTKLNADGSALLYSTFLGGLARDSGNAIAVDSAGFAYVTGAGDSGDFPSASPFQAVCGGCQAQGPDAFVAKIDPTKSGADSLLYSSFIGGRTRDESYGIAVDAASNVYVTGGTDGAFPITPGSFETISSGGDAFVVKVSPDTAPGFTLTAAPLAFGDQGVGITSSSQSVRVGNAGSAALNITSITPSGDFALDSNTTCVAGTPVDAGGYCMLSITFTPASLGPLSGSISIADDAAGSPHSVALTGTGRATEVSLSSVSLTFAGQVVGTTSAAQTLTITNTGNTALNTPSIAINGANAGDFAQTNTCGAPVAAGASCTIAVSFSPTVRGSLSATVTITDDAAGSPHLVALTGTALGPEVTLSSPNLTFAGQLVSTTSAAQTLTISNTGDATLSIPSQGVTAGEFEARGLGPGIIQVAPDGSESVEIVFVPRATGTRSGTFTIFSNAAGSPHTVALTGTGTEFILVVQPGGATSATVNAGQSGIYKLQLEPVGFSGNINLGCAFQGTTPRGASCSVAPTIVALNGTDPGPFTVSAMTTARSLAVPREPTLPPGTAPWGRYAVPLLLALTMLAALAALAGRRDRRAGHRPALQWAQLGAALLVVLFWAACGGGGSSTTPQTGTPAGNYTLNLTATAGGVSKSTTLTLRVN